MKVAFRASLVILIHANTSTDTPFANMPAITDPCHLLEAHLPPRVTLEHSATRIIQQNSTIWGLQHIAAASPFGMKPAAESLVLSRCFLHHGLEGIYCSAPLVMSNLHQPHSFHKCWRTSDPTKIAELEPRRGLKCRAAPAVLLR